MKTDKKRILVVDDDVKFTQLLKLNLEQNNCHVRVENTSASALATAEQFQPDLILLDVMMPGPDGGELANSFNNSPRLKRVPIVFFTAAARKQEVTAHGGRIGGLPFLAKPASFPEVMACIEQHLGNVTATE